MRPSPLASACFLALGLMASGALAQEAPKAPEPAPAEGAPAEPAKEDWQNQVATRRSGFMLQLLAGVGPVSMVGYPNDVKKQGYARYYTASGAQLGAAGGLFAGGAVTDWLNLGVGAGWSRMVTGENPGQSLVVLFHLEGFPLFSLGGRWRDVGVMADFGTGTGSVTSKKDPDTKLVDGGATSFVGGGVFWEAFRAWRISGGPYAEGTYQWSDTLRKPDLALGLRLVLYTGPSQRAP